MNWRELSERIEADPNAKIAWETFRDNHLVPRLSNEEARREYEAGRPTMTFGSYFFIQEPRIWINGLEVAAELDPIFGEVLDPPLDTASNTERKLYAVGTLVYSRCFSTACPFGEVGDTDVIRQRAEQISRDDFEAARLRGWRPEPRPDRERRE